MVRKLHFICVLIGLNIFLVSYVFGNVNATNQQNEVTEVVASWWGFDPEDSTEFLQAAIDSGAQRVIIPNVGHDWVVRPIRLRSNLELVLEEGVVVAAKKGEFRGRNDSLFNARDVENLTIRGYGATLRMHKEDYRSGFYERAEWRMGIAIRGSNNVQILGLTIKETGGDGIYLGRGSQLRTNENVIIRDVIADNNYRQGISVITARNLLIENSVFNNTEGTAPQAGIDFEPNYADEVLENIVIRNSIFDNNQGAGIMFHLNNMTAESVPTSVLIENVLVRNNARGISVSVGSPLRDDDAHVGEIVVRNCIVEDSGSYGFFVRNNTNSDAFHVTFEDCFLFHERINPLIPYNTEKMEHSVPIHITGDDKVAGVHFSNVAVVDDVPRPVLLAKINTHNPSEESGIYDISGDLKVFNPYGTDVMWDGPAKDVSVVVQEIDSLVVPYDEIMSHPDYRFETMSVEHEPRIYITSPSSVLPETVARGVLTGEVQLLNFPEGDVRRVEAFIDGDSVYSAFGSYVSGTFEMDTTTLDDDRHEFKVKVYRASGPPIEQSTMFVTRNFETINDFFKGPHQVAWFGEVYNPITIAQSSGWTYATDRPQDFFGDADRKFRQDNTTEFLTWEAPRLRDATVVFYSRSRSIDDAVVVEVTDGSFDDESAEWNVLDFRLEHEGTSESGWHKLVLRVQNNDPHVQFVRLTLRETEEPTDIHLGHATFRLLRR